MKYTEELEGFVDQEHCFTTSGGKLMSHVAILELQKASQVAIHEGKDHILDKISSWTRNFMEQKILDKHILERSKKEMELAMRKFYGTFDRVETRRYIESYKMDNFKILKAAYRSSNINNIDLLKFTVHDFNLCQARHKEELQHMKRWFKDCKLEQVGFSEQYIYIFYFVIAALLFEPEYADARLAYAKYTLIITVVDDFFDCFVCKEELQNIIELVERWNEYSTVEFRSERVRIFFSALHEMVEEIAAKAETKQGRCVKDHLINLREQAESSANMVSILITQSQGTITVDEAIIKTNKRNDGK
ncbi:cis-abienol synthase, chloroplastic-like [Nicotiana tabacum]|uniref:Cis-abienol synthase, chloroplastic-like n=1 Tax=Nicotiana tabacum TaxID=4097 RepID=A0AC58UJ76_TOBAC